MEVLSDQKTLNKEKSALEQRILKASSAKQDITEQIANLKELMNFMTKQKGEKLIEVRQSLRHRLRSLIDKITVYPPRIPHPRLKVNRLSKDKRCSVINLKGGSYRMIQPGTSVFEIYEREEKRTYYFGPDSNVDVTTDEEFEELEALLNSN